MDILSLAGYRPTAFGLIAVFVSAGLFAIGRIVLMRDPLARKNASYATLTALFAAVMATNALMTSTSDLPIALFWDRAGWMILCFVPAAVLDFEGRLLEIDRWQRWVSPLYLVGAGMAALMPLGLFTSPESYWSYGWGEQSRLGWGGAVFVAYLYIVIGVCFVAHLKRSREKGLSDERRRLFRITLYAIFAGVLASFDFLSSFGIPWPPLSIIFLAVWMSLYGYAVIKYRLFRITTVVAAPALLETMPGSIFVVDIGGGIVITNPYASKATLAAPGTMRGRPIAEYLPAAAGILKDMDEKAALGPTVNDQESVMKDSEGTSHPVTISASTILDEDGLRRGAVFVALGIDKLKAQMREIEDQRAKLETDFSDLVKVQKMLISREMRMEELKKEIAELKKK